MNQGTREYVVLGAPDDPLTQLTLLELYVLQRTGHLRVVDLRLVQPPATPRPRDLNQSRHYAVRIVDNRTGCFPADEVAAPFGVHTPALIVLFERVRGGHPDACTQRIRPLLWNSENRARAQPHFSHDTGGPAAARHWLRRIGSTHRALLSNGGRRQPHGRDRYQSGGIPVARCRAGAG